jgi:hypothetical protein
MTAYAHLRDVLPCPLALKHDWIDRRQSASSDSHESYKAECSWCAALLDKMWWGWEFRTGLEHFDDASFEVPPLGIWRPPLPPGLRAEQGGPNLLFTNGRGVR